MSSHPRIEAWLHRVWSHRGPTACLLYPLSLIYGAISASKRKSTKPQHLPVPVVVVGNIYVGAPAKRRSRLRSFGSFELEAGPPASSPAALAAKPMKSRL